MEKNILVKNKQQYYEIILSQLSDVIEAQNFKFKSAKKVFEKKFQYGWIQIIFDYYESVGISRTNMALEIRYDFVEEICNKYSYINPKESKNTSTFIFSVPQIFEYEYQVFSFINLAELSLIVEKYFLPFISDKLPDLIATFSDLNYAYVALTNSNNEYYHKINKGYKTIIRSLTMAQRVGKTDLDSLILDVERIVAKNENNFLSSFEIELYDTFFDEFVQELKSL
jgi:hypothetical protein